ncbi:MAG: glycosyltransferase family 39 protein [Planctomycetaceae bacterium]|nr:glycosyltransferase family 39 protein [Planctomycetaceae bacterium]
MLFERSPQMDQRCWLVLVGLLLPIQTMLLAWIACRYSPTSDEMAHLAAGLRILSERDFDLYTVNPPLAKVCAALPVLFESPNYSWKSMSPNPALRKEWNVGQEFMWANSTHTLWLFVLARWACIPWAWLGMFVCFFWARDLYGNAAALAAAVMWTFSPAILGNGALVTPDIPSASMAVTVLYAFRWYLHGPSWRRCAVVGVLLGIAELTKMTLLLLYPLLGLLLGIWLWTRPAEQRAILWRIREFVTCCVISVVVINAGYFFQGTGQKLGERDFYSETLGGLRNDWDTPGNRFRESFLGKMPIPLPAAYVTGIDIQKRDFEGHWRPMYSYLRGHQQLGGWWYYYLYCLLVKVPVGSWIVVGSALATVTMTISSDRSSSWRETALLWLPPLLLFVFVSSQTGFTRYYRYVLPAAPFVMIGLSRVFAPVVWQRRRWASVTGAAGLFSMVVASLWVYPHSLAFFNAPSGGPTNGHWHLLDSNIDWGQDLYHLRDWLNQHPQCRPVSVAYSGVFDPHVMGMENILSPKRNEADPAEFPPGWYAVSVNHLHGYDDPGGRFTSFLALEPVDRAGYSILIYEIAEPTP